MAMETYGIINIGSASKKYAFYADGQQLLYAHFEHDREGFSCTVAVRGEQQHVVISAEEYAFALRYVLARAQTWGIPELRVSAMGVRVVAPGTYFEEHRLIDAEYRERLARAATIAPLHISYLLQELGCVAEAQPRVPLYGISDSAFHKGMPKEARMYGIPQADAARFDVYRFGYHGLSVGSVARLLADAGDLLPRVIVCHLGSGASVTALAHGKSVDTSMGFTPDEGVLMATRVGAIDAGAVLYLAKHLGGIDQTIEYVNHQSGLLGVSGSSPDIRVLLEKGRAGDVAAREALDLYVYLLQKQIGAYAAVLGGLDALVFTGTVGERSHPVRGAVCAGLAGLGVAIDHGENARCYEQDMQLQSVDSRVKIFTVRSREMDQLALLTAEMHAQ